MPNTKNRFSREKSVEYSNPPATIDLIFSHHGDDNWGEIIQAVKRAQPDIIAIEHVGCDKDELERMTATMHDVIAGEKVSNERLGELMYGDQCLAEAFAGSGVECVFVDIPQEDPHYDSVRREDDDYRTYANIHGDTVHDRLRRTVALEAYIQRCAENDDYREQLVAHQLEQLVATHPNSHIAAVVGITHTPLKQYIDPSLEVGWEYVSAPSVRPELARGEAARFETREERAIRAYKMTNRTIEEVVAGLVDETGRIRQ